jgi:hypothetical protein
VRAARARRGGEAQNLDSLLDTMANVTGILVLLLVSTQLSVGDAVARLRDELVRRPELSRSAFEAAERDAAALREALAPLLPGAAENEALRRERRSELGGLRTQVSQLEAELQADRGTPRSQAELAERIAAAKQQAQASARAIERNQRAAAAARTELAALPAQAGTRDLRLPDPRPPPPGAAQVAFFCRHGRILRIDGAAMLDRLWDGVRRATGGTTPERLRASALDRARVVDYFRSTDVGSPDLRWHALEMDGELLAQLEWRRPDLGETREQIDSALSRYRSALLELPPRGVFFHFFVWDDSFEVYLAARELADRAGFAAGWTPYDAMRPFRQPLTQMAQTTLID